MRARRIAAGVAVFLGVVALPGVSRANGTVMAGDSATFVTAFQDATTDQIVMTANISLSVEPMRPAASDPLTIDGAGFVLTAAPLSNVLDSSIGAGDLTLQSVTITGSNPQFGSGGAVVWRTGNVNISGSTVTANSAVGAGGGVMADGGNVVVTNSTFSNNSGPGNGGGIWSNAGSVTVTGSTFGPDNRAPNGGAIMANTGPVTITNTTITGNRTTGGGGGGVNTGGLFTATDSTISANRAGTSGGGVLAGGGANLTRSTINDNVTGTNGGGSGQGGALQATAPVTLLNSTVTGNTSDGSAGGIVSTTLTVVYSTIVGNSAPTAANLRTFDSDPVALFGSVIASPLGGGANCTGLGPVTSRGYNYEGGANTCGLGAGTGDTVNGANPVLGALANNGGSTATLLPLAGSPLVDAIAVGSCQADGAAGVTTDQRGVIRPTGSGCDIGAVEVGAVPPPTTTTMPPGVGLPPADVLPQSPPAATPITAAATFTG